MAAPGANATGVAEPAKPPADTDETDDDGWEFELEMNFSSAYVWRGLNQLGQGSQRHSPGVFLPGFTATRGMWTFGWAAASQLTGKTMANNVRAGPGLEQFLYTELERTLAGDFLWHAGLMLYTAPGAREESAGADQAAALEPMLGISWGKGFKPFFKVHFFSGIQEALRDGNYVYFNVGGAYERKLAAKWNLNLETEGGFKWLYSDEMMGDNRLDIQGTVSLDHAFSGELTLRALAGIAWTNLEGKSFADELAFWVGTMLVIAW